MTSGLSASLGLDREERKLVYQCPVPCPGPCPEDDHIAEHGSLCRDDLEGLGQHGVGDHDGRVDRDDGDDGGQDDDDQMHCENQYWQGDHCPTTRVVAQVMALSIQMQMLV